MPRKRRFLLVEDSFLIKPFDFGRFQSMMEDVAHYWGDWNEHPE